MYGAQFLNAGFRLRVDRLPPGTYDLIMSADAIASGSLRGAPLGRITVR